MEQYRARRDIGIGRLGSVCAKCASNTDLEFDHIKPEDKAFDVASSWSMALDKWLEEVNKCQLLCKICHREKTNRENTKEFSELTHNRWRYLRYKCRCFTCKEDYSAYRKARYAMGKG